MISTADYHSSACVFEDYYLLDGMMASYSMLLDSLFIVYKKIRCLESVVIFSPIPTGFFVPAEFFRGWRGKTPKNRLCRVRRRKNASCACVALISCCPGTLE